MSFWNDKCAEEDEKHHAYMLAFELEAMTREMAEQGITDMEFVLRQIADIRLRIRCLR